jgi:hypothetical protein
VNAVTVEFTLDLWCGHGEERPAFTAGPGRGLTLYARCTEEAAFTGPSVTDAVDAAVDAGWRVEEDTALAGRLTRPGTLCPTHTEEARWNEDGYCCAACAEEAGKS